MTDKAITLSMTSDQQLIVLDALYQKLVETNHYLASHRDGPTPGPLDECCAAHLACYEERRSQREMLLDRKMAVHGLINLVENAATALACTVDPHQVTLVYADRKDGSHEQPATDVVNAGTLIDPETGDDMCIVAVRVQLAGESASSGRT